MKIKVYYIIWDSGDGSAYAQQYSSLAEANDSLESRESEGEFSLSEGVRYFEVNVD